LESAYIYALVVVLFLFLAAANATIVIWGIGADFVPRATAEKLRPPQLTASFISS
jgi:hypothetical protein